MGHAGNAGHGSGRQPAPLRQLQGAIGGAGAYAITAGLGLLATSEALRRSKPWSRHLVAGFLACFAGVIFTDIARSESVRAAVISVMMARLELRQGSTSGERPTRG